MLSIDFARLSVNLLLLEHTRPPRWRTLGGPALSRCGLEIDGHGGAQWEATSVRLPKRSSDRFWFRSEFRWPRWRTSGSDLGTVGDCGAHWGDDSESRFNTVWKSMATVAHSGKRFRFDFQHGRPIDSGFGLSFDGHGGAQWEAISVRFPTRSSDRFWFRSGFRWPRWRTSGSDLDSIFAFIPHPMWESGVSALSR